MYIVTGVIGFAFHIVDFKEQHPFPQDLVWVELVRLLAIVSGVYMLRGSNWARWLALAWIAFHVVLSAFHSWVQLAVHIVLCVVFGYFLFRQGATQYFRGVPSA